MAENNSTTAKPTGIIKKLFIGLIILVAGGIGQVIGKEFTSQLFKKSPSAFNWQAQSFNNITIESPLALKSEPVSKSSFPAEIGEMIDSVESYRANDAASSIGISYIAYKDGVTVNLEKALEGSLQSSAKSMNPNANPEFSKTEFQKNGIDGLMGKYSQSAKGSNYNVKVLVFLRGQKMYNAMFIWSTGRATEKDADRFFDSIKITSAQAQGGNSPSIDQ